MLLGGGRRHIRLLIIPHDKQDAGRAFHGFQAKGREDSRQRLCARGITRYFLKQHLVRDQVAAEDDAYALVTEPGKKLAKRGGRTVGCRHGR